MEKKKDTSLMIPLSKPGAAVRPTGLVVGAGWCGLGPQGCAGLHLFGPYLVYLHLVGVLQDLADLLR